MKTLQIFNKTYTVREQTSDRDYVELQGNDLVVHSRKKLSRTQLKELLSQLLYEKLVEISKGIELEGKVGVFGKLDFEIKENIDKKKHRIAKLKGNKILVKLGAVTLPESLLKYVIAHEIAHSLKTSHTTILENSGTHLS